MAMEGKIWLWRGIYGLLVGENGILGCLMQCRIIHVARVANARGLGSQRGLRESKKCRQGLEYPKMLTMGPCMQKPRLC